MAMVMLASNSRLGASVSVRDDAKGLLPYRGVIWPWIGLKMPAIVCVVRILDQPWPDIAANESIPVGVLDKQCMLAVNACGHQLNLLTSGSFLPTARDR